MESQEKFRSYADVNKEIQALISSKENTPHRDSYNNHQETENISVLLETLIKTYNEINAALQTENSQALKDVVLKSDIKMSMVCETLLETLRKTTEEKNSLIKENQVLEKIKRELEGTITNNKLFIEKIKNELEFKKTNVEELNRIISDQKNRMTEFKEECIKANNEVQFFKAKIGEIENLRGRANERMAIYEKELDGLNTVIKDKDERIKMLVLEKRNEEEKNSNVKIRLAEFESIVDALNKKLEIKDRNMSLCNSELSKVLCENKKLKIEHEKYKEGSLYYEGLYNSLNTQNAYLNTQLNKLLKMNEYSKDIEGYVLKFKKKLKRRNREIKRLNAENQRLKEQEEEVKSPDDTSEYLIKKIENLNETNERYKRHIDELEDEKKALENKMKNIRIGPDDLEFKERIKGILNKTEPIKDVKSLPSELKLIPSHSFKNYNNIQEPVFKNYNNIDEPVFKNYNNIDEPVFKNYNNIDEPKFKNYNNIEEPKFRNIKEEPKLSFRNYNSDELKKHNYFKPNQYNHNPNEYSYYKVPQNNFEPMQHAQIYPQAGPDTAKDSSYLKLYNLENNYDNNDFIGGFVNESGIPRQENKESVQMNNFDKAFTEKIDDTASIESVKTYHTSSTLKEMMAKTDKLQKKFDDLENKLAQINEGESVDKLTDKIKTCNSYYSEWNANSNESDYI